MAGNKNNKDLQLHLRLTKEEAAQIKERMEMAGTRNMSAYALRMMLYGFILHLDLTDVKEILRLVQRCGNNINQIARKANESGYVYPDDIKEIREGQKEIIRLLGKLLDRFNQIK